MNALEQLSQADVPNPRDGRPCRIEGCGRAAAHHKTVCHLHHRRLVRYGDPHFTQWTAADEHDVDVVARERRPVSGLTRLEQRLVALKLTAADASAAEIADLLGVSPRTVHRWRANERQAA
jgi:DNA-directed RNA polymerase specialized sigma24 family protein